MDTDTHRSGNENQGPETRWLSTGFFRSAPEGGVDREAGEAGVIRGALVCSEGPALGHGINLEGEFIDSVVKLGNAEEKGLKARFGHPNMCASAIGTFLGNWHNLTKGTIERTFDLGDGKTETRTVAAARGDLHFSKTAANSPTHGDMSTYLLDLAEEDPDKFGTSIVFIRGKEYKRDAKGKKLYYPGWYPDADETAQEHDTRKQEYRECPGPTYTECKSLHACDAVDDPAANDGMFSTNTTAGQITEFLDLNPQVLDLLDNPAIVKVLESHPEQIEKFLSRYKANQTKERPAMSEPTKKPAVAGKTAAGKGSETPKTEAPPAGTTAAGKGDETPAGEGTPKGGKTEAGAGDDIDRSEFARTVEKFGAVVAAEAFGAGGGYAEAQDIAYEKGQARIKELEAGADEPPPAGATPALASGSGADGAGKKGETTFAKSVEARRKK